jgi:hypothetical protein
LEWNGVDIDDKSARVGGKQLLVTFDGFSIPINIRSGLPYINMCPHTDQEWEELPHILLTEDANSDPMHMDHKQGDDPAWYEQQDDPPLLNSNFNLCGDYRHHIVYKSNLASKTYTPTGWILVHEDDVFFDTPGDEAFVDAHSNKHNDTDVDIEVATDHCEFWANVHRYVCSANTDPDADTHPSHHRPHKVSEAPHDYDARHSRFAWLPTDIIKKTFEVTTQYARMPLNTILCKW